ncbi:MAG: family 16 glycoside hydrolase, partial [Candidatus Acidiferrum sp.]
HKPGRIEVRDGTILLDKGSPMTGITYSRGDFPKIGYEVSLEAKKIDGDDFFCTTTFPVGDSWCSFVVGGWGGTTVGLSSIASADASANETSKSKEFKRDQWYRIRIKVTKDKIECWIDDEKMVNLDTADKKIGIRIECAPCKPFGIATYETKAAVRKIQLRR